MCLLTIHIYRCGCTTDRTISTSYLKDGALETCAVEANAALDRSCSKIDRHTQTVKYKCVRCKGSLNWNKDYQQSNRYYSGRYL